MQLLLERGADPQREDSVRVVLCRVATVGMKRTCSTLNSVLSMHVYVHVKLYGAVEVKTAGAVPLMCPPKIQ